MEGKIWCPECKRIVDFDKELIEKKVQDSLIYSIKCKEHGDEIKKWNIKTESLGVGPISIIRVFYRALCRGEKVDATSSKRIIAKNTMKKAKRMAKEMYKKHGTSLLSDEIRDIIIK